jgi:hypothetical protein
MEDDFWIPAERHTVIVCDAKRGAQDINEA